MPDTKADLVIHPIRMRIIQSLAMGGKRWAWLRWALVCFFFKDIGIASLDPSKI